MKRFLFAASLILLPYAAEAQSYGSSMRAPPAPQTYNGGAQHFGSYSNSNGSSGTYNYNRSGGTIYNSDGSQTNWRNAE